MSPRDAAGGRRRAGSTPVVPAAPAVAFAASAAGRRPPRDLDGIVAARFVAAGAATGRRARRATRRLRRGPA